MKHEAQAVIKVSETRFAHFVRSASPAERQRVFVRAMKVATEEQRKVLESEQRINQQRAIAITC